MEQRKKQQCGLSDRFKNELEYDGYRAGKHWDDTCTTIEEFQTYVKEDMSLKKYLDDHEMTDQQWEEAFKIWKDQENDGIWDSEDDHFK